MTSSRAELLPGAVSQPSRSHREGIDTTPEEWETFINVFTLAPKVPDCKNITEGATLEEAQCMQERPRRSLSLFRDLFFRPTILLSLILSSPLPPSSHVFLSPSNIFPFCVLPLTRFVSLFLSLTLSSPSISCPLLCPLALSISSFSLFLSLTISLSLYFSPSLFLVLDSWLFRLEWSQAGF